MTAGIGILGGPGATGATGTGTMTGGLVGDQRVALVALRSRTAWAAAATARPLVAAMGTAATAAVMDRDTLERQPIRWVPLEIRASRGPPSSGACSGPLRMG